MYAALMTFKLDMYCTSKYNSYHGYNFGKDFSAYMCVDTQMYVLVYVYILIMCMLVLVMGNQYSILLNPKFSLFQKYYSNTYLNVGLIKLSSRMG